MKEHQKKMGEKPPFRSTAYGKKPFNNTRKVFGEEGIDFKVTIIDIYWKYFQLIISPFCCTFQTTEAPLDCSEI